MEDTIMAVAVVVMKDTTMVVEGVIMVVVTVIMEEVAGGVVLMRPRLVIPKLKRSHKTVVSSKLISTVPINKRLRDLVC